MSENVGAGNASDTDGVANSNSTSNVSVSSSNTAQQNDINAIEEQYGISTSLCNYFEVGAESSSAIYTDAAPVEFSSSIGGAGNEDDSSHIISLIGNMNHTITEETVSTTAFPMIHQTEDTPHRVPNLIMQTAVFSTVRPLQEYENMMQEGSSYFPNMYNVVHSSAPTGNFTTTRNIKNKNIKQFSMDTHTIDIEECILDNTDELLVLQKPNEYTSLANSLNSQMLEKENLENSALDENNVISNTTLSSDYQILQEKYESPITSYLANIPDIERNSINLNFANSIRNQIYDEGQPSSTSTRSLTCASVTTRKDNKFSKSFCNVSDLARAQPIKKDFWEPLLVLEEMPNKSKEEINPNEVPRDFLSEANCLREKLTYSEIEVPSQVVASASSKENIVTQIKSIIKSATKSTDKLKKCRFDLMESQHLDVDIRHELSNHENIEGEPLAAAREQCRELNVAYGYNINIETLGINVPASTAIGIKSDCNQTTLDAVISLTNINRKEQCKPLVHKARKVIKVNDNATTSREFQETLQRNPVRSNQHLSPSCTYVDQFIPMKNQRVTRLEEKFPRLFNAYTQLQNDPTKIASKIKLNAITVYLESLDKELKYIHNDSYDLKKNSIVAQTHNYIQEMLRKLEYAKNKKIIRNAGCNNQYVEDKVTCDTPPSVESEQQLKESKSPIKENLESCTLTEIEILPETSTAEEGEVVEYIKDTSNCESNKKLESFVENDVAKVPECQSTNAIEDVVMNNTNIPSSNTSQLFEDVSEMPSLESSSINIEMSESEDLISKVTKIYIKDEVATTYQQLAQQTSESKLDRNVQSSISSFENPESSVIKNASEDSTDEPYQPVASLEIEHPALVLGLDDKVIVPSRDGNDSAIMEISIDEIEKALLAQKCKSGANQNKKSLKTVAILESRSKLPTIQKLKEDHIKEIRRTLEDEIKQMHVNTERQLLESSLNAIALRNSPNEVPGHSEAPECKYDEIQILQCIDDKSYILPESYKEMTQEFPGIFEELRHKWHEETVQEKNRENTRRDSEIIKLNINMPQLTYAHVNEENILRPLNDPAEHPFIKSETYIASSQENNESQQEPSQSLATEENNQDLIGSASEYGLSANKIKSDETFCKEVVQYDIEEALDVKDGICFVNPVTLQMDAIQVLDQIRSSFLQDELTSKHPECNSYYEYQNQLRSYIPHVLSKEIVEELSGISMDDSYSSCIAENINDELSDFQEDATNSGMEDITECDVELIGVQAINNQIEARGMDSFSDLPDICSLNSCDFFRSLYNMDHQFRIQSITSGFSNEGDNDNDMNMDSNSSITQSHSNIFPQFEGSAETSNTLEAFYNELPGKLRSFNDECTIVQNILRQINIEAINNRNSEDDALVTEEVNNFEDSGANIFIDVCDNNKTCGAADADITNDTCTTEYDTCIPIYDSNIDLYADGVCFDIIVNTESEIEALSVQKNEVENSTIDLRIGNSNAIYNTTSITPIASTTNKRSYSEFEYTEDCNSFVDADSNIFNYEKNVVQEEVSSSYISLEEILSEAKIQSTFEEKSDKIAEYQNTLIMPTPIENTFNNEENECEMGIFGNRNILQSIKQQFNADHHTEDAASFSNITISSSCMEPNSIVQQQIEQILIQLEALKGNSSIQIQPSEVAENENSAFNPSAQILSATRAAETAQIIYNLTNFIDLKKSCIELGEIESIIEALISAYKVSERPGNFEKETALVCFKDTGSDFVKTPLRESEKYIHIGNSSAYGNENIMLSASEVISETIAVIQSNMLIPIPSKQANISKNIDVADSYMKAPQNDTNVLEMLTGSIDSIDENKDSHEQTKVSSSILQKIHYDINNVNNSSLKSDLYDLNSTECISLSNQEVASKSSSPLISKSESLTCKIEEIPSKSSLRKTSSILQKSDNKEPKKEKHLSINESIFFIQESEANINGANVIRKGVLFKPLNDADLSDICDVNSQEEIIRKEEMILVDAADQNALLQQSGSTNLDENSSNCGIRSTKHWNSKTGLTKTNSTLIDATTQKILKRKDCSPVLSAPSTSSCSGILNKSDKKEKKRLSINKSIVLLQENEDDVIELTCKQVADCDEAAPSLSPKDEKEIPREHNSGSILCNRDCEKREKKRLSINTSVLFLTQESDSDICDTVCHEGFMSPLSNNSSRHSVLFSQRDSESNKSESSCTRSQSAHSSILKIRRVESGEFEVTDVESRHSSIVRNLNRVVSELQKIHSYESDPTDIDSNNSFVKASILSKKEVEIREKKRLKHMESRSSQESSIVFLPDMLLVDTLANNSDISASKKQIRDREMDAIEESLLMVKSLMRSNISNYNNLALSSLECGKFDSLCYLQMRDKIVADFHIQLSSRPLLRQSEIRRLARSEFLTPPQTRPAYRFIAQNATNRNPLKICKAPTMLENHCCDAALDLNSFSAALFSENMNSSSLFIESFDEVFRNVVTQTAPAHVEVEVESITKNKLTQGCPVTNSDFTQTKPLSKMRRLIKMFSDMCKHSRSSYATPTTSKQDDEMQLVCSNCSCSYVGKAKWRKRKNSLCDTCLNSISMNKVKLKYK